MCWPLKVLMTATKPASLLGFSLNGPTDGNCTSNQTRNGALFHSLFQTGRPLPNRPIPGQPQGSSPTSGKSPGGAFPSPLLTWMNPSRSRCHFGGPATFNWFYLADAAFLSSSALACWFNY